jgi:hypothetical protein
VIGKTFAKLVVGCGLLGMLLTCAGAEGKNRSDPKPKAAAAAADGAEGNHGLEHQRSPDIPSPTAAR